MSIVFSLMWFWRRTGFNLGKGEAAKTGRLRPALLAARSQGDRVMRLQTGGALAPPGAFLPLRPLPAAGRGLPLVPGAATRSATQSPAPAGAPLPGREGDGHWHGVRADQHCQQTGCNQAGRHYCFVVSIPTWIAPWALARAAYCPAPWAMQPVVTSAERWGRVLLVTNPTVDSTCEFTAASSSLLLGRGELHLLATADLRMRMA